MLELTEKVPGHGAANDSVSLPYELRQKSRRRVHLDSGREASILLAPGTPLDDGDRLRAADGTIVCVRAAPEPVSTATAGDPLRLLRASYHLGNRHVALQVGTGWLRYQPDHVLDDMLRGLGLTVVHESTPFEPERGAYHSHGHAQNHSHGHTHPHHNDVATDASEATPATSHGHRH